MRLFEAADKELNDVVKLVKGLNQNIALFRNLRDELHQKMLIWDEAIEKWDIDLSHRSKAGREAVQFTYQFVAYNFPQSREWF